MARPVPKSGNGNHKPNQTAFGDLRVAEMTPRVQLDALYGLHDDTETFSATGGAVEATGGEFHCQTGTSLGGYGTIRSLRAVRYRPGQGALARWTMRIPTAGVANSLVTAGMFSGLDAVWFGYNGTEFGCGFRQGGAYEIRVLTLSAGAGGAETVTVTLDGTGYAVSVTSGTTAQNAHEIATGRTWANDGWNVTANGSTVVFHSRSVSATQTNTYSISSTGTCDGTFARTQAGAANDQDTFWVAQADWNGDTLDGGPGSAFTLDPSKGNVYAAGYQWLGYGAMRFYVENPVDGEFLLVHQLEYANTYTRPSLTNPTMRVGWIAASLGSTTDLEIFGASAAGFIDGPVHPTRNPRGVVNTNSVSSEEVIVQIRNRLVYGNTTNQQEVFPKMLTVGVEGNKPCEVRAYLDCTRTGTEAWTYRDESDSIVEIETSGGLTVSGGRLIIGLGVAGGGSATINLQDLDIHMVPGAVLTVTASISGGAGDNVTAGITWLEE